MNSMLLGIFGLVGALLCLGVPLLISPIAWLMGNRAAKEIDANPGRWSGRERAQAGRLLGMIGTVLLVLSLLGLAVVLVVAITS